MPFFSQIIQEFENILKVKFSATGVPNTDAKMGIKGLGKSDPYVEVGYGIENILKIIRVDFVHRLNYLDRPDVDRFGVKVSFQFIL